MVANENAAAEKAQQKRDPNALVHVWPHLVGIELVAALVFTMGLIVMAVLIKAPLVDLADPQVTPNPAKAPWYFLNLQELLLHMHPMLAGVLVPGAVLTLIAAIPYIDSSEEGTGVYFSTRKGFSIAIFSSIYTFVWLLFLILFDEFVGVTEQLEAMNLPTVMGEWIVPIVVMFGIYALLAVIVRRRWNANTREIIIALFIVFLVSWIVLTIVGTAFRGPGMDLVWPWQLEGGH